MASRRGRVFDLGQAISNRQRFCCGAAKLPGDPKSSRFFKLLRSRPDSAHLRLGSQYSILVAKLLKSIPNGSRCLAMLGNIDHGRRMDLILKQIGLASVVGFVGLVAAAAQAAPTSTSGELFEVHISWHLRQKSTILTHRTMGRWACVRAGNRGPSTLPEVVYTIPPPRDTGLAAW
jgi:hypothetical protein